jgi:hypothetical protein
VSKSGGFPGAVVQRPLSLAENSARDRFQMR